jgi:hypothetical protein
MEDQTFKRLILKEDDIMVVTVPTDYFNHRDALASIYRQIREKLLASGKKNKILIMPKEVDIAVIGEKEINEHVSNVDLWHLFDENETL